MGYSATLGSIRKAITEQVSILELANAYTAAAAYETIYSKTLDFRNQNYLVICVNLANDGGGVHTYLRLRMNSTVITTFDSVGAGGWTYSHMALPAGTAIYGTLTVEMHSNGADTARLYDLNVYLSES